MLEPYFRYLAITVLIVGTSLNGYAQDRPMTNDDVIAMCAAGLTDAVVTRAISAAPVTRFDVTPPALIKLKTAGVTPAVMEAMLMTQGSRGSSAVAAPASQTSAPEVPGVYVSVAGVPFPMQPVVCSWESGGRARQLATAGVIRAHEKGVIRGLNSETILAPPAELLIAIPPEVSIAEYQVLRLQRKAGHREFRPGHISNLVKPTLVRSNDRLYRLDASRLAAGEYAILVPAAGTAQEKVYTFAIR